MTAADVSLICKALSDSNRLEIVQMLTMGEKCACELLKAFVISQPTLSHHMRILADCELVRVRKDGKWSYYSLNCDTLTEFRHFIDSLRCDGRCKGCDC